MYTSRGDRRSIVLQTVFQGIYLWGNRINGPTSVCASVERREGAGIHLRNRVEEATNSTARESCYRGAKCPWNFRNDCLNGKVPPQTYRMQICQRRYKHARTIKHGTNAHQILIHTNKHPHVVRNVSAGPTFFRCLVRLCASPAEKHSRLNLLWWP